MNKKIVLYIILIACLGALAFLFRSDKASPINNADIKSYSNPVAGLSFTYPKKYYLEEKEVGNAERSHYVIILTEDTEENRLVREGKSPGRDGPIAITVDIYQNNLDKQTIAGWIKNTSESNYKLSDGILASTTVAGREAFSYSFDGLYLADSVVASFKDSIISFTVTYINRNDQIRNDFQSVLQSLKFLY